MNEQSEVKVTATNSLVERLLNKLLKPHDQELDPWNAYKPRVFVTAIVSLMVAIIIFNLIYYIAGNTVNSLHGLSLTVSLVSLLSIYIFYRAGGQLAIATQLFMLMNTIILSSFILLTGGFDSPVISLLALIPFLGLVIEHKKAGFYWVGISTVVYIGFYVVKSKDYMTYSIMDSQYTDMTQIFGWITLCACIVIGLFVYGKATENTTRQLHFKGQTLARNAEIDSRSGLLNSVGFERALVKSLARSDIYSVGLILLKLNNQNEIKSELDRGQMTLFMQEFAKECNRTSCLRAQIAQLHNDETGFIMTNVYSTSVLSHLAQDLVRVFKQGIKIQSRCISVDVSCGIAMSPEHGKSATELLKNADQALSLCNHQTPCQIYTGSTKTEPALTC